MRCISANHADHNFNANGWKIPHNIELVDPELKKSQKINILEGAETFFNRLAVGQIKSEKKILLGWIVSGKYVNSLNTPPKVKSTLYQVEGDLTSINSVV